MSNSQIYMNYKQTNDDSQSEDDARSEDDSRSEDDAQSEDDSRSENDAQSEDDSSTSTTSYESYDWTNEVENTNNMKNILREQLIQPIMGKPFKPLFAENEFDDSFELSLLRFVHLVFSVDGLVNFENLNKFMDMNQTNCANLNEYFVNNPGVMIDYSFYYSNAGIDVRTEWIELLNGHNYFTYKEGTFNETKGEIEPSLYNFFEFFENFFPNLNLDGNTDQEKMSNIVSQLNFNFESFEVVHSTYQKIMDNTVHNSTILNFKINNVDMYVLEMTRLKDLSSGKPVEVFTNSEFRYA